MMYAKRVTGILLAFAMLLSAVPPALAAEEEPLPEAAAAEIAAQAEAPLAETPAAAAQSNITMSMGSDESQMNFTWYFPTSDKATLLVSTKADMSGASTIAATGTLAGDGQYSCKATVTGLEPGTTYYYRCKNGSTASAIASFKTGGAGAFSFALVADPQIYCTNLDRDRQGWSKSLKSIKDNFGDISFMISAGDQINNYGDPGTEDEYDVYLDQDLLKSLPVATVIGNHDSHVSYQEHFNIANQSATLGANAAKGTAGDSYFVYNNTLFMMLNSNNLSVADHKQFMKDAIAATAKENIQWKIVTFHHSIYTVASHAGDSYITSATEAANLKLQLTPVLKELDIDVVLQGHDHVYCRTYMMDGFTPMTDKDLYDDENYGSITNPSGILYITANSGSGSKFYGFYTGSAKDPLTGETINPDLFSAVKNQEKVPNVSKISISPDQFTITTYRTSDMSVVDTFTINHTQTDISLSVGADESRMNFTWHAPLDDNAGLLLSAKADMSGAKTIAATATPANDNQFSCKATATGLKPGTTYYYQLKNGDKISAPASFKTGAADEFSFAYVADPQIGASGNAVNDTTGWGKTLGIVAENEKFSDISFMLSAGDQVDTASNEAQYDGYLNNDKLKSIPVATVIGNHDSGSAAYNQHFNVANESTLGKTTAGGDSYFVYDNTLFMTLNSNNLSAAEHRKFMEDAIAATRDRDIRWKVVSFHHTLYTAASHSGDGYLTSMTANKNLKLSLTPVLKELDIDVVLAGHDHVYCRTYMMDGFTPMKDAALYDNENFTSITDPTGILYITANSGSGSKFYDFYSGTTKDPLTGATIDPDLFSAVKNQEKIPNVSKISISDTKFTITTYRTSDMSVVDTFTINRTAPARTKGYYNSSAALKMELAGRFDSGKVSADGGSLEIVQYNPKNGFAYAVSGVLGELFTIDMNRSMDGSTAAVLSGVGYDLSKPFAADGADLTAPIGDARYDIGRLLKVAGFTYGDMTSVAISPDGTKLAAALQDADYTKPGRVALFSCNDNGSLTLLGSTAVGVQPDMVTFADNKTILTADEGEPRETGVDPKGSVSIVTIGAGNALDVYTATFDKFDAKRAELVAAGVLIQKNTQPSTDFEPEYIAVSGRTAYVSLQEANAIAVLNIDDGVFTGVYPMGFQDYGKTKVNLENVGDLEIKNYPGVYGIKMPDGISVAELGGKTYLLTANEGDSRAWENNDAVTNEVKDKASPTGNIKLEKKTTWFDATKWDGLDAAKAYVFGGRSFSIYEMKADGMKLVYDSGSEFEEITKATIPNYFNASNDSADKGDRAGKKGPEPEGIVTGQIGDRTYAFVALERISGIMAYDITNPASAKFVNYINTRDFSEAIKGDVGQEGLSFVSAAKAGGKPMLLTSCEVSGTLAAYSLTGGSSGGSTSGYYPADESTGTKNSDGSTTMTSVDRATGAVTTTKTTTSGVTGTTVTDKDGKVTALRADIPAAAVKPGVTVKLPVEATAAKSANDAPAIAITVPKEAGRVRVEVPVKNVSAGTVAVLVKADGTEEIIKTSIPTETGVALALEGGATVKIVDNSKDFADAASHWAGDAVKFVSARGILVGTGSNSFTPEANVTRAQILTVLARFDGEEIKGGENWQAQGAAWAKQKGISDGSGLDSTLSREQLATMLYRYAGSPAVSGGTLDRFTDCGALSSYAADAMRWAVEVGLISGVGENTLSPNGSTTRAQLATILTRYCGALAK